MSDTPSLTPRRRSMTRSRRLQRRPRSGARRRSLFGPYLITRPLVGAAVLNATLWDRG